MKSSHMFGVALVTTILIALMAWDRARSPARARAEPPAPAASGAAPRVPQAAGRSGRSVPELRLIRLPRDTAAADEELARLLRATMVQIPEGELTLEEAVAVVEAAVGGQVVWGTMTERSSPLELRVRRDIPIQAATLLELIGESTVAGRSRWPEFELGPRGGAIRCLQLGVPEAELQRALDVTRFRLECRDAPWQQVREVLEEVTGVALSPRPVEGISVTGNFSSAREVLDALRDEHGLIWPLSDNARASVQPPPAAWGAGRPTTEEQLRTHLAGLTVNIGIQEAPVAKAMELLFTELGGVPVRIADGSLEDQTCTLHLREMSADQALDIVCQLYHLTWHWENGEVVVTAR